jgi:hypothetical protein
MDEQRQRIFAKAAERRTKPEPVRTLAFDRTKATQAMFDEERA